MKIRSWRRFTKRERVYFRNTVDQKDTQNTCVSSRSSWPIGS
jgi:hypothetical protein